VRPTTFGDVKSALGLPQSDRFIVKIAPIVRYRRAAIAFLKDMVQERLTKLEKGDDTGPDDLLQWLIVAAPPEEKTVVCLVERLMALEVASIHTTTMVSKVQTLLGPKALHSADSQVDFHCRSLSPCSRTRQVPAGAESRSSTML